MMFGNIDDSKGNVSICVFKVVNPRGLSRGISVITWFPFFVLLK